MEKLFMAVLRSNGLREKVIIRPAKSPVFCGRLPHFEEKCCLPPACKNF